MNTQQIQVNLAFTADTTAAKAQLQSLQTQLNSLTTSALSSNPTASLNSGISQAITQTQQLQVALRNATSVDTGKLNLNKFSLELNKAGLNAKQLGSSLQMLGPQGVQAFSQVTQAVMNAEMSLAKTNTIASQFMTTFLNTAKWQLASSLIHGVVSGIQGAFRYAEDLNESLNNIRIVTGYSADEMERFAIEANKAAKALNTTTTEYTNASLIYYQQGLSNKEVIERTNATIKLANVTGQAVEDVSNQLTAIWNNFDNGTKSLESYVDVVTALGAATASSSDEIAQGLEKFAAVAETVGLSYEYATAALATVTATTRQSADVVGTAFKTLFARIQDLELGDTLEDGTTLGKYSEALNTIGVNIKDSNGNLKEMNDILNEMGAKWDTLSKAQQVSTAQTVAGVRQYTQLIALMDNWEYFQQNLQVANTAEGTLNQQAEIYAESWGAAKDQVKAAMEEIYSSLLNDDFFINLTKGFAEFIDVIDNIIDGLGGLKGIVAILGSVMLKAFGPQLSASINRVAADVKVVAAGMKEAKGFSAKMGILGQASKYAQTERAKATKESFMKENNKLIQEMTTGKGIYGDQANSAMVDGLKRQSSLYQQFYETAAKLTDTERQRYQLALDTGNALRDQANSAEQAAAAAKSSLGSEAMSYRTGTSGSFGHELHEFMGQGNANIEARGFRAMAANVFKAEGFVDKAGNLDFSKAKADSTQLQNIMKKIAAYADSIGADFKTLMGIDFEDGEADFKNMSQFSEQIKQDMEAAAKLAKTVGEGAGSEGRRNTFTRAMEAQRAEELRHMRGIGSKNYDERIKEDLKNKQDEEKKVDGGQAAVSLAMGMMQAEAAVDGLIGAFETLKDSSKSVGDKVIGVSSGLISTGTSTMFMYSSLESLGKGAGKLSILLVGLSLAIKALGASLNYMDSLKPEKKLQKAREEYEKNKEAIQETTNAVKEHIETAKELENLDVTLSNLTAGTTEWYLAIQEANKKLIDLLKTYNMLDSSNYTISASGVYELTDQAKKALDEQMRMAQTAALSSEYINEIGYLQQQQAIRNEKYAATTDIFTMETFAEEHLTGLVAGGGSAVLLGWGGAAAGAAAGTKIGGAIGSMAGPIGAVAGALVGLAIGIVATSAVVSENNQAMGNAAEILVDGINNAGLDIEAKNFVNQLESLGYTLSDTEKEYIKSIEASEKAREALLDFANETAQISAEQKQYWEQITQLKYGDSSLYKNSKDSNLLNSLVAQGLQKATEFQYDSEYKDKGHSGGGIKDEVIQEAYRKEMDYVEAINKDGNKAVYIDQQGNEIEVSDAVARRYLAQIKAEKTFDPQQYESFLRKLLEMDTGEARLLTGLLTDRGADLVTLGDWGQLNPKILENLIKNNENIIRTLMTDEEYAQLLQEAERLTKDDNIALFGKSIKQGSTAWLNDFSGKDNLTKQQYENLFSSYENITQNYGSSVSQEYRKQLVAMLNDILIEAGNFLGANSEEFQEFLASLYSIDYSTIDFQNSLFSLGETYDLNTEAILKNSQALSKYTITSANYVSQLASANTALQKSKTGDIISAETYESYSPNVKQYYRKKSDNTYELIDAESAQKQSNKEWVEQGIKAAEDKQKGTKNSYSSDQDAAMGKLRGATDTNRKTEKFFGDDTLAANYSTTKITEGNLYQGYITRKQTASLSPDGYSLYTENIYPWVQENRPEISIPSPDAFKYNKKFNKYEFEATKTVENGTSMPSYLPYIENISKAIAAYKQMTQEEKNSAQTNYNLAKEQYENFSTNSNVSYDDVADTIENIDQYDTFVSSTNFRNLTENEKQRAISSMLDLNIESYGYIKTQLNKDIEKANLIEDEAEKEEAILKAYDKALNSIRYEENIAKTKEFATSLNNLSKDYKEATKGSVQQQEALKGISQLLQTWDINISVEDLETIPGLMDKITEAAGGTANGLRALFWSLSGLSQGLPTSVGEIMLKSAYLTGKNEAIIPKSLISKEKLENSGLGTVTEEGNAYRIIFTVGNYEGSYVDKEKEEKSAEQIALEKADIKLSMVQEQKDQSAGEKRLQLGKLEEEALQDKIKAQKAYNNTLTDANEKLQGQADLQKLNYELENLKLENAIEKYTIISDLLEKNSKIYDNWYKIRELQGLEGVQLLSMMLPQLNTGFAQLINAQNKFNTEEIQNIQQRIEKEEEISKLEYDKYFEAADAYAKAYLDFENLLKNFRETSIKNLENTTKDFDRITEQVKTITTNLKTFRDLLKSAGIGLFTPSGLSSMENQLNTISLNNERQNIQALIQERRIWEDAKIEYMERLNKATSTAEKKYYEDLLESVEKKLNQINSNILNSLQSALDVVSKKFESNLNSALYKYNSAITKYGSLDSLKEAYNFAAEKGEEFLDETTQGYELSKLSRQINQEISKQTSERAKNQLRDVLETINDLQEKNTQLSQLELKNLQAKYDLRLAEIALEEAQWNKTQMRLQRNANGTWNYVYTVNQDSIAQAQQNLEDKQQQFYQQNLDAINEKSSELLDSLKQYGETEAEISRKLASGEISKSQAAEQRKLNKENIAAAQRDAAEIKKAMEAANISWSDTNLAEATGAKSLDDFVKNMETASKKLSAESSKAVETFSLDTQQVFQLLGITYQNSITRVTELGAKTNTELITELGKTSEALLTMSGDIALINEDIEGFWQSWGTAVKEYLQPANQQILYTITLLQILQALMGQSFTTATGNTNTFTASDGSKVKRSGNYTAPTGLTNEELNQVNANRTAWLDTTDPNTRKALEEDTNKIMLSKGYVKNEAEGNWYDKNGNRVALVGAATGGYTGDWAGDEGRIALLHKKELILNQEDTSNILSAVNIVRGLSTSILKDVLINANNMLNIGDSFTNTGTIPEFKNSIEQEVRIEANFPNVNNSDEIEAAFADLVNQAAQFASIKKL